MLTVEQQVKTLAEIFKVGGRYAVYQIGSATAMTSATRMQVRRLCQSNQFGAEDGVIFTRPRKRKEYRLQLCRHASGVYSPMVPFVGAIFEGWEQPIICDTEGGRVMHGNACYNFVGTPENIRTWIEDRQLNPYFERERVVAIDPNDPSICGDMPLTVVYPELVETGNHAVIDRLMAS